MANLTEVQVDQMFNDNPSLEFLYFDDENEQGFYSFAERQSWFKGEYSRNGLAMITGRPFSHTCENHHTKY